MIEQVLDGKVVLVTGANSPIGIGAATARAFSNRGARVFVHYWRLREWGQAQGPDPSSDPGTFVPEPYRSGSQASPDGLLGSIRERGGVADAWEADLADAANVRELFDRAERNLGPVDVLINNAAYWHPDTFLPAEQASTRLASTVPMRRVARPEEIADLVVLLCSDEARLLTGQRLHALGY